MFVRPEHGSHRRPLAWLVSAVLHCLAIYLLVRPPRPVFVRPSSVALGRPGASSTSLYWGRDGLSLKTAAPDQAEERISWHRRERSRPAHASRLASTRHSVDPPGQQARAGSAFGSLVDGPLTGYELRPALPIVFPDPAVSRSELPAGASGEVEVEITIDAQGNVVDTKIVESMGRQVDDKVLAAVRNWRFKPAMKDGTAIPSQQDVFFHFPS
jgi:TonB family protein